MKRIVTAAIIFGSSVMLAGCGATSVEIPSGHVGKIQTKDGFQDGVRHASKFRLDRCTRYCDRLVTLDVSDSQYTLQFKTYMPKDQLHMGYMVKMTMGVKPSSYEQVFSNIPFDSHTDQFGNIPQKTVFNRYAKPVLETDIPGMLSNFSIGQIQSDRSKVNGFMKSKMNEALADTPFIVKHVGLTNIEYPEIITRAKERAAERKENEEVIKQQRELDLLQIETDLLVDMKRRKLEIQKAETRALIANKLMTPEYASLMKYETLQKFAESDNKVFIPTEMLDSIAAQGMLSK